MPGTLHVRTEKSSASQRVIDHFHAVEWAANAPPTIHPWLQVAACLIKDIVCFVPPYSLVPAPSLNAAVLDNANSTTVNPEYAANQWYGSFDGTAHGR